MPSANFNYSFSRCIGLQAIAFSPDGHHIGTKSVKGKNCAVELNDTPRKPRRLEMFGRGFDLPDGRWQRIALGAALVFFGFLGFLPVLGFWMIPLGLFVLSLELASVRRLRRRLIVRFSKRREKTG